MWGKWLLSAAFSAVSLVGRGSSGTWLFSPQEVRSHLYFINLITQRNSWCNSLRTLEAVNCDISIAEVILGWIYVHFRNDEYINDRSGKTDYNLMILSELSWPIPEIKQPILTQIERNPSWTDQTNIDMSCMISHAWNNRNITSPDTPEPS